MWYNSQAVREIDSEWSLKIEQQREKYKAKKRSANLVKELYILNKVREAKN